MSDRLGFVYYGEDDSKPNFFEMGGGRDYSEATAKAIDEETKSLIDRLYDECRKILEANKDRVEAMSKALMRYETLDASEVDRIMKGETLTKPTVGDLLEKEQSRRGTVIQPAPDAKGPDLNLGGGHLPAPG
jgi:cell division protease FtsH